MDKKTTIGNVCFIRDKKRKAILLLRRNREPMQNMFTGVGGKTDFDEDVNGSCIREVREETGLLVKNIKLKGVIKTILSGKDSAWILFVYVADDFNGKLIDCNEGELVWVNSDAVFSHNLIGFIRRILPNVLADSEFIEGVIEHDIRGGVISERLQVAKR